MIKAQYFMCVDARVHKGLMCERWISISLRLIFFRSVQNTDKYTSTKHPPHLMLFVCVVWLPTDIQHNHNMIHNHVS